MFSNGRKYKNTKPVNTEYTDKEKKNYSPYDDELPEWKALPADQRVKEWYELSADGNPGGANTSVPDTMPDFSWYLQAAGKGDTNAQYVVGKMYIEGILTDRNPLQAGLWFSKASEEGNPFADYELAKMCESGTGIHKNMKTAESLYIRAYKCFADIYSRKQNPEVSLLISVIRGNGLAENNLQATGTHENLNFNEDTHSNSKTYTQKQKASNIATPQEKSGQYKKIPSNLLVLAANNPYNTNDTDVGLYSLAMSINANGLINPLLVNRFSDAEYRIISGERRYLAITRFLHWDTIPCMVYDHLSKNSAQLKLHTANLAVREYTAWQKLQFYVDTERLLSNMQKSGEYTGPVQKGIAELLGISTHQVRKYKRIAEGSSETQLNNLRTGKISIEKAYQTTRNKLKTGRASAENGEPDADVFTETGRASAENSEPDADVPLSDPTNYMDAVRMLKSLPVKPGQSCTVQIDDDVVPASVDRIELYENALIISVMVEDVRRSYPVSRIGTDLLIVENS